MHGQINSWAALTLRRHSSIPEVLLGVGTLLDTLRCLRPQLLLSESSTRRGQVSVALAQAPALRLRDPPHIRHHGALRGDQRFCKP